MNKNQKTIFLKLSPKQIKKENQNNEQPRQKAFR